MRFVRFASRAGLTLVAHRHPPRRQRCSDQFGFEGELACIIGRPAKNVPRECKWVLDLRDRQAARNI